MPELDKFIGSLSPEEQRYVLLIASYLQGIFEDLEKKGYLRANLRGSIERTDFVKILEDSDKLFESYNMLFPIFWEKGRSTEFVRHNEKFGLYDKGLAYLFLSESISAFQRNVELFKNCFLFTLKVRRGFKAKMTLGQFLCKLVDVTGTKGEAIAREIDVNLRNGLTHGLFWMDRVELVYYEDITLKKQSRIGLDNLWMKARNQSLVTQCLIKSIVDWFAGT